MSIHILLCGFLTAPLASLVFSGVKLPIYSRKKVGGLTFLKIGKFQCSYSWSK